MGSPEGRVTMPALDALRGLPDGSVGLVVTDPPWNLGEGHFAACASYDRMELPQVVEVLREARRVLVPGGHLYCFAPASDWFLDVATALRADGWTFLRVLAWEKGAQNGLGAYRNAWEPVLIFSNGPSRGFEHEMRYPSLITARPTQGRTSKPWPVYRVFLEMSSRAGELVVDPFCGTNPLAEAVAHVSPPRRWLAADVLTPEAVDAQLENRTWAATVDKARRPRGTRTAGESLDGFGAVV